MRCLDYNGRVYYKCTHNEQYYNTTRAGWYVDDICNDDPAFYQVCGHIHLPSFGLTGMLCGFFICDQAIFDWYELFNHDYACLGEAAKYCNNIKNTDIKECSKSLQFDCKSDYPQSTETVPISAVCDDWCDCSNCADEAMPSSSGYPNCTRKNTVGLFCNKTLMYWDFKNKTASITKEVYIEPHQICNRHNNCDGKEDEQDCPKKPKGEGCYYEGLRGRIWKKLSPSNKCSVPNENFQAVCMDFSDQFGCPDEANIGLQCIGEGGEVVLSKYLVDCNARWILSMARGMWSPICLDEIDSQCHYLDAPLGYCLVHKHRMCDNYTNCEESLDETDDMCSDLENVKCVRRVGKLERYIPSQWVADGIRDCEDGKDENATFWQEYRSHYTTCGDAGSWSSISSIDCSSEKYFFCANTTEEMVPYARLCDRSPSCGNEERICRVARNLDLLWKTPPHDSIIGYCLPGLNDILRLKNKTCQVVDKNIWYSNNPFGVTKRTTIFPEESFDCRFLYGIPYVTASCLGACSDNKTVCKMEKLLHDSCNNIQDRVMTVATPRDKEPYLTLVEKVRGDFDLLTMFECETGACVGYDKVCDLANDCGDWSDERNCSNQFICRDARERIPWTRHCDGVIDCSDHSDECDGLCGHSQEVISNIFLVAFAWIIGFMATITNVIAVVTTTLQIYQESSIVKITNMTMVVLIAVGDLCVGAYLIAISVVNFQFTHSDVTFCYEQFNWLTSNACPALGILNTFGSQLSLYSMTMLSMLRVFCVKTNALKGNITLKGKVGTGFVCLGMLVCAGTVSCIPIATWLENYFVNGLVYFDNPMFTGIYSKKMHIEIIQKYYGNFNLKSQDFTWAKIRRLVADMFTRFDRSGSMTNPVVGKEVSFYGNSGVCLFKFFVRPSDPQKRYTWFVILQNAACFIFITISYLTISVQVERSSSKLGTGTGSKSSNNGQSKRSSRTSTMNRKITLMIITDFLCWVPFILVCSLHYFQVLDATPQYSIFSIVILPLNAVINPILYDNSGLVNYLFLKPISLIRKTCPKLPLSRSSQQRVKPTVDIELTTKDDL